MKLNYKYPYYISSDNQIKQEKTGVNDLRGRSIQERVDNNYQLILSFQDLSFSHIYREHNQSADRLSKTALSYPQGKGSFKEYFENHLVSQDTFQLF